MLLCFLSARERPNLVGISASGRVTAAQGSATPESGSTLTNSCTDDDIDIRSVDFDGAVHMFTATIMSLKILVICQQFLQWVYIVGYGLKTRRIWGPRAYPAFEIEKYMPNNVLTLLKMYI